VDLLILGSPFLLNAEGIWGILSALREGESMFETFGTIWARRELLGILIVRNLKIRYKGSMLGFFWSLLSPALLILIYGVFAAILRFNQGRPHYLQFLVSGIVIWQFLGMCLNDSLHVVLGNANLVKKTAFPRLILPISMVLANLVNFLLTLVVLFAYLLLAGMPMQGFYLIPLVLLCQMVLCLGLACILSTSNVFMRDTEHILGIGTLAWFFLSPVFYPLQMQLEFLPERFGWLPFLNPMAGILYAYRSVMMGVKMPDVELVPGWWLAVSVGVCLVVLVIGYTVFQRAQRAFGDVL
jgi:lipopolysaccharide transport system permease protein